MRLEYDRINAFSQKLLGIIYWDYDTYFHGVIIQIRLDGYKLTAV